MNAHSLTNDTILHWGNGINSINKLRVYCSRRTLVSIVRAIMPEFKSLVRHKNENMNIFLQRLPSSINAETKKNYHENKFELMNEI